MKTLSLETDYKIKLPLDWVKEFRTLRRHINDRICKGCSSCTFREDGMDKAPGNVETASGSQIVWKVVFKEERHRQNANPLGEMTFVFHRTRWLKCGQGVA